MAKIYEDFLAQFKLPSRQVKMESKRTIIRHAPALQLHSGLSHEPKWRTEVAVSTLTFLSDFLYPKRVTTCFV